jgi:uncharacterized protein (DUF1499 family)
VISLIALPVLFLAIAGRERSLTLAFGPIETKEIDFQTLELGPNPNQFLVCPTGYCSAEPHLISPIFPVSADTMRQRWNALIKTQPRIEIGKADDNEMQYDYIQRSSLMRYPDSITVKFIDLDNDSSTLAIYSRSHYGKSDFGVNESRIQAWLSALNDAAVVQG